MLTLCQSWTKFVRKLAGALQLSPSNQQHHKNRLVFIQFYISHLYRMARSRQANFLKDYIVLKLCFPTDMELNRQSLILFEDNESYISNQAFLCHCHFQSSIPGNLRPTNPTTTSIIHQRRINPPQIGCLSWCTRLLETYRSSILGWTSK